MRWKFSCAIIIVFLVINVVSITLAQRPKSLYNIIAGRDGFSSFDGKNYLSIEVYLNNNSNDTLYYRGADCDNLLFSIKGNPYFHLADYNCHQGKYLKAALAPHRARKMELYLTMDKTPDRNVSILINMNLYKWTGDKAKQSKELVSGNMSDSVVMHYDINHQSYWPKDAFEIQKKKQRSILPDQNIHLLTNTDRQLYKLTIDKAKIGLPRDTIITNYENNKTKKAKVITVPVILHNNSNDTLRFYSMTCSWYSFFGTNSSGIGIPGWDCSKNITDFITIAPHKEYKKNLSIVYYPNINSGNRYRISMSLLKAPGNVKWTWNFWPEEYVRFNKIWSNELTIQ
jgi:hypothetical protein